MTFQPYSFVNNGIVPAFAYYNELNLTALTPVIQLYFPQSFTSSQNYLAATNIVTATISGGDIILPDPTYGAPGNAAIFVNLSANSFDIVEFGGTPQLTVAAGTAWQMILRGDGTWLATQLGATTSSANASALAGYGLAVQLDSPPKLETNINVIVKNSNFIPDQTMRASSINWTGGNQTITLPLAAVMGNGYYFYIKCVSNSILTLQTIPPERIDGQLNLVISNNESCIIYSDGVNYFTNGLGNLAVGVGVKITNNGIQVVDGSATTPSIAFINNPNTGIYSTGNTIDFTINGTQGLEINNEGVNVVVGAVMWQNIPYAYLRNLFGT
jgi:hypothetical protein